MDSLVSGSSLPVDPSKLSDNDKKEIQQFVVNETQKARIQQYRYMDANHTILKKLEEMRTLG
ncbi:MAG: hypothetical protein Q9157_000754 [Trypethelium eluteriae]